MKVFGMECISKPHTDFLIAQALGKDVSCRTPDGSVEVYEYQGQLYFFSIKANKE